MNETARSRTLIKAPTAFGATVQSAFAEATTAAVARLAARGVDAVGDVAQIEPGETRASRRIARHAELELSKDAGRRATAREKLPSTQRG